MLKYTLLISFILTTPIYAQQPSSTPDPIEQSLAQDWQSLQNAQRHIIDSVQVLMQDRTRLKSELDIKNKELDNLKAKNNPNKP